MSREPWEIESEGAFFGLNPFFGELNVEFDFAPVPRSANQLKRAEFIERVRGRLSNLRYLFSREVKVEIEWFLDFEEVLSDDDYPDVDNIAKVLLDALKGPGGVLIDDVQVQSLCISRIDSAPQNDKFAIRIKSSPDDFILKPITFFEMCDKLWYPVSEFVWENGNVRRAGDVNRFFLLEVCRLHAKRDKFAKHAARRGGLTQREAYYDSRKTAWGVLGFHKSRVEGFPMVLYTDAMAEIEKLGASLGSKASEIQEMLRDLDAKFRNLISVQYPQGR